MNRWLFLLIGAMALLASAVPAQTPERQAELLALDWARGNIRGMAPFLSAATRDAQSSRILKERQDALDGFGRIRRIYGAWSQPGSGGGRIIYVSMLFQDDTERDLRFQLRSPGTFVEGALESVTLAQRTPRPAATPAPTPVPVAPAPYVNPRGFVTVQHPLNVGTRHECEITVLIPRIATEESPVPVVLLLAGEGPLDEDGTIGFSKLLRDIAMGLADNGVATVRFPKRQSVHAGVAYNNTGFTLQEEQLEDAVNAMRIVLQDSRLDQRRIGICGHDLGALAALDLGGGAPEVLAVALLAPPPGYRLETAIDRSLRYADIGYGSASAAMDARGYAESLRAGTLPEHLLLFDLPPGYWRWFDRRDYGASAAIFTGALFLGFPEVDEEGSAEDLERWQRALRRHPRAQFRQYAGTGHDFLPGVSRMDSAMYTNAHHVSPELIRDLVFFFSGAVRDEGAR